MNKNSTLIWSGLNETADNINAYLDWSSFVADSKHGRTGSFVAFLISSSSESVSLDVYSTNPCIDPEHVADLAE